MHYETHIAGHRFRPLSTKEMYEEVPEDSELLLEPEPTNKHDPWAVKVMADGEFVGYIPKELSPDVSKIIADGRLERCIKKNGLDIEVHYAEEAA